MITVVSLKVSTTQTPFIYITYTCLIFHRNCWFSTNIYLVGVLLTILQKFGIKIINGRPRHPQSQELIEQANEVLIQKIASQRVNNQSTSSITALPEAIHSMNGQYHTTTCKTPYEIVFKQRLNPNDRILPGFREYSQVKDG